MKAIDERLERAGAMRLARVRKQESGLAPQTRREEVDRLWRGARSARRLGLVSLHVAREPAVLEPRDDGRAVRSSGWKGRLWWLRQRRLSAIGEERAVPPVLRAMTRAGIGDACSRRERGGAGEKSARTTPKPSTAVRRTFFIPCPSCARAAPQP